MSSVAVSDQAGGVRQLTLQRPPANDPATTRPVQWRHSADDPAAMIQISRTAQQYFRDLLAKQNAVEVRGLKARVHGMMDRSNPIRTDHSVFNSVRVELEFEGTDYQKAFELAEQFKKR